MLTNFRCLCKLIDSKKPSFCEMREKPKKLVLKTPCFSPDSIKTKMSPKTAVVFFLSFRRNTCIKNYLSLIP